MTLEIVRLAPPTTRSPDPLSVALQTIAFASALDCCDRGEMVVYFKLGENGAIEDVVVRPVWRGAAAEITGPFASAGPFRVAAQPYLSLGDALRRLYCQIIEPGGGRLTRATPAQLNLIWRNGHLQTVVVAAVQSYPGRRLGRSGEDLPAPLAEAIAAAIEQSRSPDCQRFDVEVAIAPTGSLCILSGPHSRTGTLAPPPRSRSTAIAIASAQFVVTGHLALLRQFCGNFDELRLLIGCKAGWLDRIEWSGEKAI